MSLTAYWWKPTSSPVTLAKEGLRNGPSWARVLRAWPRASNFGDAVNEDVLGLLLGRPVTWAPMTRASMTGIGSVLDLHLRARSGALVLGSGVRSPHRLPEVDDRFRELVLGVRGHHSATALGLGPDAAIGDPGLLARRLRSPEAPPTHRLVIPHFAALGDRTARRHLRRMSDLGGELITPNRPPLDVLGRIRAADLVLTSSLHAFVFADAVGTPCQLVSFPGADEPTFKYLDYQSVFSGVAPVGFETSAAVLAGWAELDDRRDTLRSRLEVVDDQVETALDRITAAAAPLRTGGGPA